MKIFLIILALLIVCGCSNPNTDTVNSENTQFQITTIDINARTYLITDTKNQISWTVGEDGVPHYLTVPGTPTVNK